MLTDYQKSFTSKISGKLEQLSCIVMYRIVHVICQTVVVVVVKNLITAETRSKIVSFRILKVTNYISQGSMATHRL